MNNSRHAEIANLWRAIIREQNISGRQVTVHNVVVVQVDQAVCDLQRVVSHLLRSQQIRIVVHQTVETAATTEFEDNARVRTIETNAESLHQIWMRRNATTENYRTLTQEIKITKIEVKMIVWATLTELVLLPLKIPQCQRFDC